MTETTGRKLDTGRQAEFGVTGKPGVGLAIVEKVLSREVPVEGRKDVLGCDSVTCGEDEKSDQLLFGLSGLTSFIEDDRKECI